MELQFEPRGVEIRLVFEGGSRGDAGGRALHRRLPLLLPDRPQRRQRRRHR